ncbi:hypothetical protein ACFLTP_02620 [Chloroflexota bacterium]
MVQLLRIGHEKNPKVIMTKKQTMNVSVQVLPLAEDVYPIVDNE